MNRRVLYKYRTGESTIGTMVSRRSRSKPPVADAPAPAPPPRTPGPGRPKDPGKRAAILEAAKAMFTRLGFDGASMDQIAAEAGVSKLTVYSHFGDKESLFAAAVQSHCDTGLPSDLFEPAGEAQPVRERLLSIAEALFSMISSHEALAGHRMLCSPQLVGSPLAHLFWEAGPQRVQDNIARVLARRMASGELAIGDGGEQALHRAAAQLCALLKGELHAMLVLGCCEPEREAIRTHLEAAVDVFLRAYAPPADTTGDP